MSSIHGRYFDGQSSRPHSVSLKIFNNKINIIGDDGLSMDKIDFDDIATSGYEGGSVYTIKTKEYPCRIITFTGPDAVEASRLFKPTGKRIDQLYDTIMNAPRMPILLGGMGFLIALLGFYFVYAAPYIGERVTHILPRSFDTQLGEQAKRSIDFLNDVDESKSMVLDSFYMACGFSSDYDISLNYIDSEMVNAFALPGGDISIMDGIVHEMNTWEELAALIAHEQAHVDYRHSVKALARSLSTFIVFSSLTNDVSGISSALIEGAVNISQLTYSRTHEQEADQEGLSYMIKAGINPQGMVDLLGSLEDGTSDLDESERKTVAFLSSHPLSAGRVNYIETLIEEYDQQTYEDNERAAALFLKLKTSGSPTSDLD